MEFRKSRKNKVEDESGVLGKGEIKPICCSVELKELTWDSKQPNTVYVIPDKYL